MDVDREYLIVQSKILARKFCGLQESDIKAWDTVKFGKLIFVRLFTPYPWYVEITWKIDKEEKGAILDSVNIIPLTVRS